MGIATAVVTGGGGGIGSAICEAFVARGRDVVLCDKARAVEVANSLGCEGVSLDVTNDVAAEASLSDIWQRHGGIDILVNCAGGHARTPVLEMTAAEFNRVLWLNLGGPFVASSIVARLMVRHSKAGRIVNVGSISGQRPVGGLAHYSSAKAGVAALTRAMAYELARFGITVNSVAPGLIATPLTAETLVTAQQRSERISKIPLGRVGAPADVVPAIELLVSEEAAWMTGVEVVVDGGQLLWS